MHIASVKGDKCDLHYNGTIIENVKLPRKYVDDITICYNEGFTINVEVDNYFNKIYN
jgi:hypothetical protein